MVWVGLVALLTAACNDDRVYVGDGGFVQLALTDQTAPAVVLEDGALYVVETRLELDLRQPSDQVMQDLRSGAGDFDSLPFARLPWVERDDLAYELDFTLTNVDDARHNIVVTLNGFNEFHEYMPGFTIIDEEPVADFSQWERSLRLEPQERVSRTVREEEFDEMAVDLATVVNGAPNPQQVVYFENKSSSDARSMQYIPEVIPGLCGVRLGLRSTEQANVLIEATLRVREVADRLADEEDETLMLQPEPVVPADLLASEP